MNFFSPGSHDWYLSNTYGQSGETTLIDGVLRWDVCYLFSCGTVLLLAGSCRQLVTMFVGIMALISLLVYIICFSLGLGAIPWIMMSEVFPSNVKGLAGSLATLMNWLAGWVVTVSFNSMLEWSSAGSFVIFAGICAITLVFVALRVPETKGKTLEEIQAHFR
ncbi:hypothetical protein L7F22_014485 [Adiantum nelumboides]|nr:hypothetical protein [Adiantum nelumboides]